MGFVRCHILALLRHQFYCGPVVGPKFTKNQVALVRYFEGVFAWQHPVVRILIVVIMEQVLVQILFELVFGDLICQRDSPWHQLTDGSLH